MSFWVRCSYKPGCIYWRDTSMYTSMYIGYILDLPPTSYFSQVPLGWTILLSIEKKKIKMSEYYAVFSFCITFISLNITPTGWLKWIFQAPVQGISPGNIQDSCQQLPSWKLNHVWLFTSEGGNLPLVGRAKVVDEIKRAESELISALRWIH